MRICGKSMVELALGLMCMAAQASAGQVVYTRGNPPKTPKLKDLELRDSVSQYGITWTFAKPARVGRFVNGDWYVVGPVTVIALDPKPLHGTEVPEAELDKYDRKRPRETHLRNGSMLNPPAKTEMACDSGVRNHFRVALDAKLPVRMKPTDSLISTISLKLREKSTFMYHPGDGGGVRAHHDNCPVKAAAVLTCVAAPQPPDAFRPGYCDRQQTIYLARNLKREQLPRLERIRGAPDPVKFAEVFQRVWYNVYIFGFDQPMENMPHYGQWIGYAVGNTGLLLCMDFRPQENERLLINFIQVGIDYWGLVKSGHPGWEGWGGHAHGRKFLILFAGFMLGDDRMARPSKSFPKTEFGEDNQTRYGDCWTGAKVVFAGHSGISSSTGRPPRPKWGPYEHLPPSQWDKGKAKNMQSEAYRRANTSNAFVGQALAMRILRLEKCWNHDPFFDYVDRWMFEDGKEFRREIHKYFSKGGEGRALVNDRATWFHQGNAGERWVKLMWDKYRTAPGMPPTDGWKKKKEGPSIPADLIASSPGKRK